MTAKFIRIYFFISLFFAETKLIQAQNEIKQPSIFSGNYGYGFIIAHRENMAHLIKNHVKTIGLSVSFPTTGTREWHKDHNYPEVGLFFSFINLGNPEQLGNSFTFHPFIKFKRINKEKLNIDFRFGGGIGYISNKFDVIKNHKNNVVSSNINSAFNFQINAELKISEQITFLSGLCFSHFSNGAFKFPNLGLNIITANTAISYKIGSTKLHPSTSKENFKPHYSLSLIGASGTKQITSVISPNYFTSSFILNGEKKISRKTKFNIGIDLFYDTSLKPRLQKKEIYSSAINLYQSGIHFGYSFLIGNLDLLINNGFYILTKFKSNGIIYNRIGLRYNFKSNIILNFSLKTHFAKADQLELGIGYKIK